MLKISKLSWKKIIPAIMLAAAIVLVALIANLEANLPSVDVLKDARLQEPLKIYSADGKLLAEYGETRRTSLTIDQVPKQLISAILATEDRRFYQHPGVDMRGILRAVVNLVSKGTKEQGGSTITMQVARNFFLTRTKTYTRKINEILLALKIEQELTKDEILELYLNKIYFGKRAYGVAAAAEVYYGTTVDNLTLAQMAMLAGLPQAPSAINPLNSPENAYKRRAHVLERMRVYELITDDEYSEAMHQPIATVYHSRPIEVRAPYIAEMVRQKVIELYGDKAYDQGLQVFTTIDSKMQSAANYALTRAMLEYDQRHGYRGPVKKLRAGSDYLAELKDIPTVNTLIPAVVTAVYEQDMQVLLKNGSYVNVPFKGMSWISSSASAPSDIVDVGYLIYVTQDEPNSWIISQIPQIEGAFVASNNNTGAILALIGGFDYEKSSFNRATQAARQPGSSFKPFVYAAALENGFTAASLFNDAPVVNDDPSGDEWRPQNHTHEFNGPTRLRVGLSKSMNLVSIRLLQALGVNNAIEFISNLGINKSTLTKGLSLALGANHLAPMQLNAAYSTFANGGFKVEPYFISKIIDNHGNIVYESSPSTVCEECDNPAPRVMSPQTAYLVTNMLQDVIKYGTGKRALQLGRTDLSGKTGTTNDQVDGWFAGYNRDISATAWVGFDEPKSLKEYGGNTALPMWVYFMDKALKGKPNNTLSQAPGLVSVRIDPTTGLLARPDQHDAIFEFFTEQTVPKNTAAARNNELGSNADNSLLETDTIF